MKFLIDWIGGLPYFKKYFKGDSTDKIKIVNNILVHSYSQYGEDLVIDGIIGAKPIGTYVDIGANDPIILNNTKRFYDRGWSGINIEPNPVLFKKLVDKRPRDCNLNIGIGPFMHEVPFYFVSADTLSSFDKSDADRNCKIFHETIIKTMNIQMQPLFTIFEKYLPDKTIDFISIDVEGFELQVLKTNDWRKYRPTLILIEIFKESDEINTYLNENDYQLIFQNSTNGIFLNTRETRTE